MSSNETFSPSSSHTILVFSLPNGMAILRRDHRPTKNRDFRPISHFISEMIQDRAIVIMEGE